MRWSITSLFAVALLNFAPVAYAQTTLRWKFVKGQQFVVHCGQQTEVETSVNNKPRRASLEMQMQLAWQVESVDDAGVATMQQSFTRLQLKTTAPETEPVVYDSAATTKPTGTAREIAAGISPLVGAKFTVQMDGRGNVVGVEIGDETKQALEKLPPDSQLKPLLSAEGLTNLFRLGGGQLPEKPVQSGDTWPADNETETPLGTLVQQGLFTFVGQVPIGEKQFDKIELKATAKLRPKADAPVTLQKQEQTKTGTLLFNTDAGHAVVSETKLTSQSVRPFRDNQVQVRLDSTTKIEVELK